MKFERISELRLSSYHLDTGFEPEKHLTDNDKILMNLLYIDYTNIPIVKIARIPIERLILVLRYTIISLH